MRLLPTKYNTRIVPKKRRMEKMSFEFQCNQTRFDSHKNYLTGANIHNRFTLQAITVVHVKHIEIILTADEYGTSEPSDYMNRSCYRRIRFDLKISSENIHYSVNVLRNMYIREETVYCLLCTSFQQRMKIDPLKWWKLPAGIWIMYNVYTFRRQRIRSAKIENNCSAGHLFISWSRSIQCKPKPGYEIVANVSDPPYIYRARGSKSNSIFRCETIARERMRDALQQKWNTFDDVRLQRRNEWKWIWKMLIFHCSFPRTEHRIISQ